MQDSRRSERGRERSEMNAKDDGLRTGGQTKRGASLHLIPVERERQREVGQGSKEGELDAMREEEVEVCACVRLLACLLAGVACVCACAHTCEPATTTPVQRRCPAARYGRWLWDDHWGFGDRRRSMQVQCIAAQRERERSGARKWSKKPLTSAPGFITARGARLGRGSWVRGARRGLHWLCMMS